MRRKTDSDKVDGIERGGGREGKKRPRNGTEGLRMRTNSKKVSGLIMWPQITSKEYYSNGLSALLRAHRPDGIFFLF